MSALGIRRRWSCAVFLFALHAAFVLLIYALWFASHDVERNMIWLTVWAFDFPISYLFVEPASTLLLAVECIVIGGVQWALIGMGIDLIRRSLPKKRSLRGTQNI